MLSTQFARELTDRECAKILGGTVGCLLTMAKPETVRAALQWWLDHQKDWPVVPTDILKEGDDGQAN